MIELNTNDTPKPWPALVSHCSPQVLLGVSAMPGPLANTRTGVSSVVARCSYCSRPDAGWSADDLALGKRGMRPAPGVEYHCENAYYGAQ
jgi:hypothetical protein